MERIASFEIDHTKLPCGMYISRQDGDIITYDLRTRLPNKEEVMQNCAIHTVEHLFATYVRNSQYKDNIIYFGPMGCRTGFYFLTRNLGHEQAIQLVKDAFKFAVEFEGEIPGSSEKECGNYRDHDLETAKQEALKMVKIMESWNVSLLKYPQ
ncbi:MAG: S-ribosylhomocysteine lyase [Clostridia bacterium]|nr:S-ribosylhomocysteine lyase [Clostridia bacterium]